MDEVAYYVTVDSNGSPIEAGSAESEENRRGFKATPYVRMGNFTFTPDSETPASTDQVVSSPQKNPSTAEWFTPKSRHSIGKHVLTSRRINFDLPEDDEEVETKD
ncbi:hypothetical protein PYW07_012140 [Mythimna separata]|uniref:Uncharacterized protein n=1 Tax=Mythimna separata TaxID=271217 RepID=A0AAD7YKM3_MYTSE|nr:hypothetical protein PYW07_012140 [Mythimna separata]